MTDNTDTASPQRNLIVSKFPTFDAGVVSLTYVPAEEDNE